MDKLPFRAKPKIVDLTSNRKLADKVWALSSRAPPDYNQFQACSYFCTLTPDKAQQGSRELAEILKAGYCPCQSCPYSRGLQGGPLDTLHSPMCLSGFVCLRHPVQSRWPEWLMPAICNCGPQRRRFVKCNLGWHATQPNGDCFIILFSTVHHEASGCRSLLRIESDLLLDG